MREKSFEALLEELEAPDVLRRDASAWALGRLGDTRALEPLIEALKHDRYGEVRASAA